MAHALCMSDNEGYRHSLKYVNTYCFFMAIVVTRTLLRLTFIGMPVLILTWGVYGDFFFPLQKRHCRVPGNVLCSSLIPAVPVTCGIFPLPFVFCEVPGVLYGPVLIFRRRTNTYYISIAFCLSIYGSLVILYTTVPNIQTYYCNPPIVYVFECRQIFITNRHYFPKRY